MSQHDYVVANASGAVVRADMNSAFSAIVTKNSGTSPPSPSFAHMWWYDTANDILYKRNAANTAWLQMFDEEAGALVSLVPMMKLGPTALSGTSQDFLNLPPDIREINVAFNQLSTDGNSVPVLRLGTSSGIEATGYVCGVTAIAPPDTVSAADPPPTTGWSLSPSWAATSTRSGVLHLVRFGVSNTWACSGVLSGGAGGVGTGHVSQVAGMKTLAGVADRLRITTLGGVNSFDLGSWTATVKF